MNLKSFKILSLFIVSLILLQKPVFAWQQELVASSYVDSLLKPYTEKERDAIHEDCKNIQKLIFTNVKKTSPKIYVATAGGPGASKTTILESYLAQNPLSPSIAYIDPDQRGLKFMINTYVQGINNYAYSKTDASGRGLLEEKYTKWRDASNYITSKVLNKAYQKGYSIAHGTTSSSPHVKEMYQLLKEKSYKIILLLCASTDDNRMKAIEHRENVQRFIQSTHHDAVQKEKAFYKNFPVYFQYAEEMYLYWTDEFLKGSKEVAKFSKVDGLKILDENNFKKFKDSYETYRAENPILDLPSFDTLVAKNKR